MLLVIVTSHATMLKENLMKFNCPLSERFRRQRALAPHHSHILDYVLFVNNDDFHSFSVSQDTPRFTFVLASTLKFVKLYSLLNR